MVFTESAGSFRTLNKEKEHYETGATNLAQSADGKMFGCITSHQSLWLFDRDGGNATLRTAITVPRSASIECAVFATSPNKWYTGGKTDFFRREEPFGVTLRGYSLQKNKYSEDFCKVFGDPGSTVTHLAQSPDGRFLALSFGETHLVIMDTNTKKLIEGCDLPQGTGRVCFAPDSRPFTVATHSGIVFLFQVLGTARFQSGK